MKRIPRSERYRQEWEEVLCHGVNGEQKERLLDALIRTAASVDVH